MRRRYLILAGVAVAIGVFVVVWHGPGRAILRGHVGDVAATMFVFGVLGAIRPATRPWVLGAITLAIAVAIECIQIGYHATSKVGAFVLGTEFDWIDLIAYVIGVAIALGCAHARSVSQRR